MRRVRVLLFTGKGGVGKTSAAAATAVRCADAGARTLILSTDPAHSLGDSLDLWVGSAPTQVTSTLYALQLDAQERMEEHWGEIQDYLVKVFNWAGAEGIEAEELSVPPGIDELFSLADIKTHAESGDWDVVIVDCAPTAETIRLLSLPDILEWYMERIFPMGRRLNRIISPVIQRVSGMPMAGDEVFGAGRKFYDSLEGVKKVLTDPERTTVRLVMNPERMVIAEARRTYTYLSLFGYRVDAVIANRLLPDDVSDPWFEQWKALQSEHLATIEEGFAPLPVLRAGLAKQELVGIERLRKFADELYGESDPAEVLHHGDPLRVEVNDGRYELVQELPFADRDDLEVGRHGDELLVRIGPYRRAFVLPDSLRRRPVDGASLRDGTLRITFGATPNRRNVLADDDARDEPMTDERAVKGVEHLQAAAHEMIEAARAFLDVVEDFVADDDKVASVAEAFTSVARGTARAGRSSSAPPEDDDPFGGVEHIRVS